VEVIREERVEGFEGIFKTYTCGHTVLEKIVALRPTDETKKFVCKLHLVDCSNGNTREHEKCQYDSKSALVEIPISREPIFSRAMEFQKEGVDFLEQSNFNAALLDEQGLGKTIQILLALRHNKKLLTPTLIVPKASLRLNWINEMVNNQWCCNPDDPLDYPFVLLDGKSAIIPGFKYYVIPMSLLDRYKSELSSMNFQLLIVDESQAFSNLNTKRTKALLEIASGIPHHICASGTPILNRASEYFPMLHMIKPDTWYNYASFIRNWIEAEQQPSGAIKLKGIKTYRRQEFFRTTKNYILRRKKREVLKDLPPFQRRFTIVDISDCPQKHAYNRQAKELDDYMNSKEYYEENQFQRAGTVLGYLMRMRHLCGVAKSLVAVETTLEFLESTDSEDKLIIGCLHDDVLDNLKLGLADYHPIILGAAMDPIDRTKKIEEFKRPDRRVCIAKILASGEGLNLQFCHNMIMLERMWNPGKEEQFEGRIDRYGQLEPTIADYIVAKNTVDEDFSQFVEDKRQICGNSLDPNFDFEMDQNLMGMLAQKARKSRL